VVFGVGGFMRYGGDFVIYQIWGTISAGYNILIFGIDSKNICHFGTKLVDAHPLHSSLQKL